jgi:hypothetical protein
MRIALLIMAIGLLWCGVAFTYVAVNANEPGLRDPWTKEAETFNPVGVKWAHGATLGYELCDNYSASWAIEQRDIVLEELAKTKK